MSRILVVDDETGIRSLLVTLLKEEGHEVVSSGDGQTALSLACEHHLDLVVLDLMLPGLDGRDVYRRLREQEGLSQVPVLFMSAAGHLRPDPQSNTAFVNKPFDIDRVLSVVDRLLNQTSTPAQS
ncbi:MAG: response regulator [Chloroflexi bacterium]|nr:response regulator [Chloroflexota bacterium]